MLRELEGRCASDVTWLQSFRSMIFGSSTGSLCQKPLAVQLEEQIILADTQLCLAILTFLTQDLSAFMRGSWLLKKAWKVYQHAYNQILALYQDIVVDDGDEEVHRFQHSKTATLSQAGSTSTLGSNASTTLEWSDNEAAAAAATAKSKGLVQSVSDYLLSGYTNKKQKKSRKLPRSKSSHHVVSQATGRTRRSKSPDIDAETVKNLMGAISFGYGAFQLSVSLLPPSMLKLVNFFGFEGQRETGLACLKYSRTAQDMRSPLATITLLWYLTIGSQIFGQEDQNVADEIEEVEAILQETEQLYAESALFLFFRGRLERMKKNMPAAIDHFEHAYYVSVLPELRLLCLHEIGWCRLIVLDCANAINEFHALRLNSQFSKGFFIYLTAICHGASGRTDELVALRSEICENIANSAQKDSQIEKFLIARHDRMPESAEQESQFAPIYWRYFLYELLVLWNTLDTCSAEVLQRIVSDCELEQSVTNEPIPGLAKLVLGCCETYRGNVDRAIGAFRQCLKYREPFDAADSPAHCHVSAFASFKLAALLLKRPHQRDEAKQLLLGIQQKYKSYDFENRLAIRIHAVLKKL